MLETIESQKSQKINVGKYTSMALSLISMLLILGIVSRLVSSHIGGLRSEDFWKFFPSLFLLIVVHELLHAAGALFSRNTTFRDIHFGFNIKWLVPYCHCSTSLTVGTYRIVLLLPLIITVPLAFLVLWADPAKWTVFLVGTTVAGCTIDVLMFFKLRSYDKHFIIKDHPSKPCCEVFFSNTDQIEAQEDPASNHLEKGFILADKSTSLFSRFGRHLERLVTLPIPISIGLMALYAFFMDVIVSCTSLPVNQTELSLSKMTEVEGGGIGAAILIGIASAYVYNRYEEEIDAVLDPIFDKVEEAADMAGDAVSEYACVMTFGHACW